MDLILQDENTVCPFIVIERHQHIFLSKPGMYIYNIRIKVSRDEQRRPDLPLFSYNVLLRTHNLL